ncbi:hypothetical protein [Rhodocaloribacter sp.]
MFDDSFTSVNLRRLPLLGFRDGLSGPHSSRTMMLEELQTVLNRLPPETTHEAYLHALEVANITGKRTLSNRKKTTRLLIALYGLDPNVPLFRLFRWYWDVDPVGRPVLALLCATARDPLLRLLTPHMLAVPVGREVTLEQTMEAIEEAAPERFSYEMRRGLAQRVRSSWTQAGYLEGHVVKRRVAPEITPATVAYALFLGYLMGVGGQMLFDTFWTRMLAQDKATLHALARSASARGWLTYRNAGGVIDVDFDLLLTPTEKTLIREQA